MNNDGFLYTPKDVGQFAEFAAETGEYVSHFGLAAANFTPIYREPQIYSIDDIDARIGSKADVEGPLLSAHRLAKFYMISCGDALLSCCELIRKDHPLHIGSAALARSGAEHGSKVMYLADPEIDWKVRVLRTYALFRDGLSEYKSSNYDGVTKLISDWDKWRDRTGKDFRGTQKQTVGSNRALIEKHFDHALAYDELSRPTHGNAIWMTLAVLHEQQRTTYTVCATMRNFTFALNVCLAAGDRLCELWGLDRDEVLATVAKQHSANLPTWAELNERCEAVRAGVDMLADAVDMTLTEDPQPRR